MRTLAFALLLAASAAQAGAPEAAPAGAAADAYLRELQRLHEADSLLELQLRIANKLAECRKTGYPCAGLERLAPGADAAPDAPGSAPVAGAWSAPPPLRVVGVYRDRARLRLDDGREIELQAGQRLGLWRLVRVLMDAVVLEDERGGRWRLPVGEP